MKKLIIVWSLLTVQAGCAQRSGTGSDPADERRVIEALQQRWAEGYVALDTAAVGRLLADDYFVVHPETQGGVATRNSALRAILRHDPNRPIHAYEQEDMDVRIYGSTAIVTAISTLRMRSRTTGEESSLRSRYIHVWIKRDGEWKLVSRQATLIPEPDEDQRDR